MILTKDGSYTLYSNKYNQHYHSVKVGAINESLLKHTIPALKYSNDKKCLNILDICFGLGYNTFSTIYYILENNLNIKVNFYSPELDSNLVESLEKFKYPKEFDKIKHIIKSVSKDKFYQDEQFKIEIFIGDAREYIKTLNKIDIVFQDAFSSDVNTELWTWEYFQDIYNITSDDAIMTTYSIATNVRLGMFNSGFEIYEYKVDGVDRQTIAFKNKPQLKDDNIKYIDMILKQTRNTTAVALKD